MRRKQILVVGFNGDACTETAFQAAYKVGLEVARAGATLITGGLFGVMEAASRGAKDGGGLTVGIIPQDNKDDANQFCDVVIATGLGHARDFVTATSADAVIVVGGGAGTLIEVSAAYQRRVPIIALKGTGGVADDYGNEHVDDRKLTKILSVNTPSEAVRIAVSN